MTPRSWIGARAPFSLSQIVRYTARYQFYGKEHLSRLEEEGRSVIWTTWHGNTMLLAGYLFRHYTGRKVSLLCIVPDDWRGETLAEWVRLGGTQAFTISMEESSLVAARRLLHLARQLKKGWNVYINPDGPDGPSRVPKAGISFLAGRSGAAVLPVGAFAQARYQLNRWDHYSVPFPFSRITVVFGEPLYVESRAEVEHSGARIAEAINQAMAKAEERHQ